MPAAIARMGATFARRGSRATVGRDLGSVLAQVQPVGSDETCDLEWYDRRGMLVRKEHHTTLSTYVTELVGRR